MCEHFDVFPSVFSRLGFVFHLKSHVLGVYISILFCYLPKQSMLILENAKHTQGCKIKCSHLVCQPPTWSLLFSPEANTGNEFRSFEDLSLCIYTHTYTHNTHTLHTSSCSLFLHSWGHILDIFPCQYLYLPLLLPLLLSRFSRVRLCATP